MAAPNRPEKGPQPPHRRRLLQYTVWKRFGHVGAKWLAPQATVRAPVVGFRRSQAVGLCTCQAVREKPTIEAAASPPDI